MKTEAVIRTMGMQALIAALGLLEADCSIVALSCDSLTTRNGADQPTRN